MTAATLISDMTDVRPRELDAAISAPAGWSFYLVLILACPLTFVLHEAAHWLAGEALGYPMLVSLNGAHPTAGTFTSSTHEQLVSAAGPMITLLQAFVAFELIRRGKGVFAYPFLFVAWMMRFAAAVVSIKQPNDEERISLSLSWGMWTLPFLVVSVLLLLVVLASRRLRLSWKVNVACYLISSAMFAAIVFLDAK